LSITFFMSPGARNWPFLMLTGLPERAQALMKSVWRHRKAGVCSTSTTCWPLPDLFLGVDVGQHRHADLLAHGGQDLQALFRPGPRKVVPDERLALSNDDL
jgi:hypothetical protein